MKIIAWGSPLALAVIGWIALLDCDPATRFYVQSWGWLWATLCWSGAVAMAGFFFWTKGKRGRDSAAMTKSHQEYRERHCPCSPSAKRSGCSVKCGGWLEYPTHRRR